MRFPVSLAAAVLALAAVAPGLAMASSHSEAPGTTKDRLIDDTDLYAFVANDAPSAVTFVGNWVPLIEPNSGPNFASFDDNASYYINVDNVGDAHKHIRFELEFNTTRQNPNTFLYNTGVVTSLTDPDLNVRQTYTLTRIDVDGQGTEHETVLGSGLPVAPAFVGPVSMPDYAGLAQSAIQDLPGGYRVFVGPRDDPFFVDLAAIFDLLTIRKVPGNKGKGVDGVGGYDCMSVVLQVPKALLTKDGQAPAANLNNHIIGVWDTAERPATRTLNGDGTISYSGGEVQVSRLGMPLVNEVVIPLKDKDKFNASEPFNDVANFGASVVDPELAGLLHALYGLSVPPAPRNDLVAVFATGVAGLNQPANVSPGEMLRLNMTVPPSANPNRLGVLAGDLAGFPNGRRLSDDIVDISERVVAGVLVDGFNIAPNNQLGDGIDANDMPFLPYFPYVAPPQNPFTHSHHPEQKGNSANSIREILGLDGVRATGAADGSLGSSAGAASAKPEAGKLSFASANPAGFSRLQFTLAERAHVTLKVYDLQGRVVRTLIEQDAAPGTFTAQWDGRSDDGASLGRGVFFARLTTDGRSSDVRKVVLQ
jgi:hypothetical protein